MRSICNAPVLWASRLLLVAALLAMPLFTLLPALAPPAHSAGLAHVAALALLTLLAAFAWRERRSRYWAVGGVLSYSLLMEILQHYHPARNFSFQDIFLNILGCLFGLALLLGIEALRMRRAADREEERCKEQAQCRL